MKVTKIQLRRIIREALLREADDMSMYDDITKVKTHTPQPDNHPKSSITHDDRQGEYNLGREDSLAGMKPQSSSKDYMRGYNEAQLDSGLPKAKTPSEPATAEKLDPNKLKDAFVSSKKDRSEMAEYIRKRNEKMAKLKSMK